MFGFKIVTIFCRRFYIAFFAIVVSVFAGPVTASDHADPMNLKELEAGITGLFVFPQDDRMIVILGIRRLLTQSPPYDLEPFSYSIHMDLHSRVVFDNEQDRLRYGGTVLNPQGISPDISMTFRLNDDATIREKTVAGLENPEAIRLWSGVRDDPFILPRFFDSNIIAIALSIPMSSFPQEQQDWVVWATSSRYGKQIDHVGRSNRTMLPRFDLLNTVPPSEHVAVLKKRHEHPTLTQDLKKVIISPLFAARKYDFVPDVMIYTNRFPAGFPNGRLLTDDVAALTCQRGDCLLWELSFVDSEHWPRQTVNDKPFVDEFPYLAEPWPDKEAPEAAHLTTKNRVILTAIGSVTLILFMLPWVLYIRCRRQVKRAMVSGRFKW